jgi:hypothetical protein
MDQIRAVHVLVVEKVDAADSLVEGLAGGGGGGVVGQRVRRAYQVELLVETGVQLQQLGDDLVVLFVTAFLPLALDGTGGLLLQDGDVFRLLKKLQSPTLFSQLHPLLHLFPKPCHFHRMLFLQSLHLPLVFSFEFGYLSFGQRFSELFIFGGLVLLVVGRGGLGLAEVVKVLTYFDEELFVGVELGAHGVDGVEEGGGGVWI